MSLLARIGSGVAVLAVIWLHGCSVGRSYYAEELEQEQRDHRATKGHYQAVLNDLAQKTEAARQKAHRASELARIEGAANDARYEEATRNANDARDALQRALRSGALSLQPWWSCGVPGPADGGTAAVAGGQDDAADLREAGALDLVSDADHADRWIGWLQAELTSTRKACGAE